ncbi:hsp70-Hsp90 organizing protein 2-like isoform X2 [Anneissia japonica]|nr:hsp70-Hsp90 organizing protein 2-like isoform X2 [Anneissia japonica]XP_033098241.1 hsp70-Hsp90 organizing protein 2-like isoform X2 [Anneissia japonica]
MSEKRYEDAIRHYNNAIALDPDNYIFYSNRSAAYAHQEEYNLSLKDAEKSIELKPDWAKGYSRKGAALVYLDRFKEAKEAYEEGLKLDPQNKGMSEELEKCIQRMKDPALSQPLSNPFAMPGVDDKLKSDPRTSQYMDNPDYQKLLGTLKRDPKSLGRELESKEVMEILSVLLGIEIKIPSDDDDDKEELSVDAGEEQLADATETPHAKEPPTTEATGQPDAEEDQPKDVMDKSHVTPVQVEDEGRESANITDNCDSEENNFDEIDDDVSDHNESSEVALPIQTEEHESKEDMYSMSCSSQSFRNTSPSQLPFHDCTQDAQEKANDAMVSAGPNEKMAPASEPSSLSSTVEIQPECDQKQKDTTQVTQTVTEKDLPESDTLSSSEKDGSHAVYEKNAEEAETMASSLDSKKPPSEEENEVPTEANHNG